MALLKVFNLPGLSTLKRCMRNVRPRFHSAIFEGLRLKAEHMANECKLCAFVFDEMCIKENLCYDTSQDCAEGVEDMARWCDGGRTQRSRLGTLTDKAVKTAKRRVAEAALDRVYVGNEALDNVLHLEYHGRHTGGVRLTEPPNLYHNLADNPFHVVKIITRDMKDRSAKEKRFVKKKRCFCRDTSYTPDNNTTQGSIVCNTNYYWILRLITECDRQQCTLKFER